MQSKKKKIEPELLQTPWQEQAITKIGEGLKQPFEPFRPEVGHEPYAYKPYPVGETRVGRILESPFYKGVKAEALREEEAGVGRLRRGAQIGGMLYSTPRLGAEAELIGGTTSRLQQLLGGMAETERRTEKEREYREFEKGGEIAYREHLRAEAERLGMTELEYEEHLRKQKYPVQQSQLAQILLNYTPWAYPMYQEDPSAFSQIVETLGKLAPMILTAIAGTPEGTPEGAA